MTKSFIRSFCITVFSVLLSLYATANDDYLTFNHLTVYEGLSQNRVYDVVMDEDGYIWIGTQDGLNKFNGTTNKIYRPIEGDTTSISSSTISKLIVDGNGELWVFPYNGAMNKYIKEQDKFLRVYLENDAPEIFNGGGMRDAINLSDTSILICMNKGVFEFDLRDYSIKNSFEDGMLKGLSHPSTWTNVVMEDNGIFYFGTNQGLLIVNISTGDVKNITQGYQEVLKEKAIYNIEKVGKDIWISDGQTLYALNSQTYKIRALFDDPDNPDQYLNTMVRGIEVYKDEMVYIPTRHGFYSYNILDDKLTHFPSDSFDPKSPGSDAASSSYQDRLGNIWITYYHSGVDYFNPQSNSNIFKHKYQKAKEPSIEYNFVTGIIEGQNNDVWLATGGGGLTRINRNTGEIKTFKSDPQDPNSMPVNSIRGLAVKDNGNVIFTCWSYNIIYELDPDTGNIIRHVMPDNVKANHSFFCTIDTHGGLWTGTDQGLVYYPDVNDMDSVIGFDGDDLPEKHVMAFEQQNEDYFWLGSFRGICRYNRNTNEIDRVFTENSDDTTSISTNSINYIYYDKYRDIIWVGTNGGGLSCVRSNESTFVHYTVKNTGGLIPNDVIKSILPDNNENLWITTNNGMIKFRPPKDPFKNQDDFEIRHFTRKDGLQDREFFADAAAVLSTGELAVGGPGGYNIFDPNSITTNNVKPPVFITEFKLFNEPVYPSSDKNALLDKVIGYTEQLTLKYEHSVIGFEFIAINYINAEKNQYAYMLENFDEDWIFSGNKHDVAYTNLPPGDYTFRVKAANNDGIWNQEGASLDITVLPPWYRTWVFYISVVVFIVAIIYAFIKWREKKLNEDKKQLQTVIDDEREKVKKQQEEIRLRDEAERNQRWLEKTISIFSDVIAKNKESVNLLGKNLLIELVKHININQASIMLLNSENKDDPYLEIVASYAYEKSKLTNNRIDIEEGLVGMCFKHKELKYIDNLPEGYSQITSGMGQAYPKYLLLVPLIVDDKSLGVMELLSFQPIDDLHITFVKKLSEMVASIFFQLNILKETNELLEQTRQAQEELQAQEEELRQNMEEMQATQEDFARKEREYKERIEELKG